MISGLHSHCSVGVDPLAFCALKQKRPLWAESQQEGVICDSNRSTKRVWKKERNWQVCLRPYSPLTVSGFQCEAAGRLFCVQTGVREPPAERLELVWRSRWGQNRPRPPANRYAAPFWGSEGNCGGSADGGLLIGAAVCSQRGKFVWARCLISNFTHWPRM